MLGVVMPVAMALLAMAMALNMWRLIRGPSLPDRVLALDTLSINGLGLIILLGIALGSDVFFEAALLIALMGFISTVAVGKYLLHGQMID